MFKSPFGSTVLNHEQGIPGDTDVIFVSDMFIEDYVGGAELTTQALIDSAPLNVLKIHSRNVTTALLEQGHQKYWVFGNFAGLDLQLIPSIVANMNYSVVEYDYKYCRYRSIEKHLHIEREECTCENEMHGKLISAFLYGAKSLWWMSEDQMDRYHSVFPFLAERENTVLSSVFDDRFFVTLKLLLEKYKDVDRKGWIVLGSASWIKGAQEAENWCKDNNKDYEIVWDLQYEEALEKLAQAEGFVYLPQGGDTCPRMVIEAKLLGCTLHLNEDVQHAKEIWFDTANVFDTEAYLFASRERFWSAIKNTMEWKPTLSGYTTTLNCNKHQYPWKESIQSMLDVCTEVVVVDGGSEDGTWKELQEWSQKEEKLNVYTVQRDWEHTRFAVFDGDQKAEARKRCTGQYCWQQDADEVIHENDYAKIIQLVRNFPQEADLISLPVIEYWGGPEKVRLDVTPWKWRLSKNKEYITHGIPMQLRKHDENGDVYAALGTDGCDYIHRDTGAVLPSANFYNEEAHRARIAALHGDQKGLEEYSGWINRCVELLPGIHHYSWFDLERKIKTYKNYWSRHWQSLYNIDQDDTVDNNMFFDKTWDAVSDNDIQQLAQKLKEKMGGWVFHSKVDFSKPTPHLNINRQEPAIMIKKLI